MLSFIIDMPAIAVYGAVGAILGAVFAAAGVGLERFTGGKYAKYLAVGAIVLTKPLTDNIIMPAAINSNLNAELPKKVDDVTTLNRIAYEGRAFKYYYNVDIPEGASFSPETIKDNGLADMCRHWKPHFDGGSIDRADYNYTADGATAGFSVTKADCL